MLKFSEFWMLVCFAHFGIDIGLWWVKRIGYSDPGVGAWIGGLTGLAFGILVMMPLANSDVRKNFRRLVGKTAPILRISVEIVGFGLLFLILGIVKGLMMSVFTGDLFTNDDFAATWVCINDGIAQGMIGYAIVLAAAVFLHLWQTMMKTSQSRKT